MLKAVRSRCAVCAKVYPDPARAAQCAARGVAPARFAVGDTVYPRYIGLPDTATVLAVRVAKGTHDIEYAIAGPAGGRSRRWVNASYTFASRAERDAAAAREQRRAAARHAPTTAAERASYRAAFRANRAAAVQWAAEGRPVYRLLCRSPHHGRPMAFFTDHLAGDLACPACGAPVPVPTPAPAPTDPAAPSARRRTWQS